jgi:hypothetical protein
MVDLRCGCGVDGTVKLLIVENVNVLVLELEGTPQPKGRGRLKGTS